MNPISLQNELFETPPQLSGVDFRIGERLMHSSKQWFSSPWIATHAMHHNLYCMTEKSYPWTSLKPYTYLRYAFLSTKDGTEPRSYERFSQMFEKIFPGALGFDYGCFVWVDAAKDKSLERDSLKLIQLSDLPNREKIGSDGRTSTSPTPDICILECPPELLGRAVEQVWVDATYGRIILNVVGDLDDPAKRRAMAILQYI